MARHRTASLDRRGIADFDELIHKKIHRILRSCLIALYFDSTTLIEIAVHLQKTARCLFDTGDPGKLDRRSQSPPPPPPPPPPHLTHSTLYNQPFRTLKYNNTKIYGFFPGHPSLCYRHEGDGKCEEFEQKTSIKDCGFFTPEGFEDQWAVNVTVNPYYRRRKCSEHIIVQPGPPSRDLVSRHKNI